MLIQREIIEIYDTTQDIPLGKQPPLRHEVRVCEHHKNNGGSGECDFCKTFHS